MSKRSWMREAEDRFKWCEIREAYVEAKALCSVGIEPKTLTAARSGCHLNY